MDKVSYCLGMSIAQNLINSGVETLEFDDFLSGVKSVFSGEDPAVDVDEGNKVLHEFFEKKQKEEMIRQGLENEKSKKEGKEYLKNHSKEDGVQTTKSGLQYKVITSVESGEPIETPTSHSRVKCHYEGRLIDGTVFDSSYKRGEPATFGLDQVIPGWTEGLQLMSVGEKYEFTIPSQLGYGERGIPGHIPGNSVLIFVVELLGIE